MALLSLMYDTGARVQEIADLTPSMVHLSKPSTIKLIGKGNKARIVPLMEKQVDILNCYMNENSLNVPYANQYPLFSNNRKEKLTRAGISYILDKYVKMARAKDASLIPQKFSCHCMRHYGERYKMVSGDSKPVKTVSCLSNHSPFYHCLPSEIRKSIRFLSSDQSGSSLVGRMSTYAASSAFLRVSVSALAYILCKALHKHYARADSRKKREAIERAYTDVSPDMKPQWERNQGLIEWLRAFNK